MCLVVWLALISPVRAQDGVATLAGQALVSGSTNGYSTNALFNDPAALVTDPAGNLFVADSQNHAIRKISANGLVTMLAGQLGVPGSGDETGAQARFDSPCGVTLDRNGNLFVSDTGNHTIRKITPAGVVTTIAGRAGQSGFADGPSSSALFNSPLGIAVAPNGTIYVADSGNHVIRAISAGGTVTTLAGSAENWGSENGSGTNARFNGPVGLALDDQESLFVADSNNHTIRRITPDGAVSTWAGVPGVDGCVDGDAPSAKFCKPAELAIDRKNNLFVADSFNHVIRRITRDGKVSTITGVAGSSGAADGVDRQARFFNPYGLAFSPDGSLFVADAYNELIRVVLVPFSVVIQTANGDRAVTLTWDSIIGRKY
ncbi:MAG TPA: NHL repeat-containing protein, partial [Verrucomicrobiae bacterium]|nr:NHL repeat-containing protein [Verrucomicrobiae bacterium]